MEAERRQVLILQFASIVTLTLTLYIVSGGISAGSIAALLLVAIIWHIRRQTLYGALLPFLVLLLSFVSLPGNAGNLGAYNIHIQDVIQYEKGLFNGILPSYWLQTNIVSSPIGPLVTLLTSTFYASHFVVPIVVAIVLWYRQKKHYWRFVVGLSLVSYIGIAVYILFPAAPPWWATLNGYLVDQPVYLQDGFKFLEFLVRKNRNPVAAMPSLHMAFPTFIALFCVAVWGRKATWMLCLPLLVGFSTVYMGHHYVVDLAAGVVLSASVMAGFLVPVRYRSRPRSIPDHST